MCLAIPGQVKSWIVRDGVFASARVEFGAISRAVNMQCVPDAAVGDYVLVHAGIAINVIDPQEAQRTLALLQEFTTPDEFDGDEFPNSSEINTP